MPAVNPGTTSLVSWWSLDETSGDRADSHGGLTLTAVNAPGSGTGKKNGAVDCESSSTQYLTRPGDDASLSAGGRSFTIGAWVNVESGGGSNSGRIMSKRQANSNADFDLYLVATTGVTLEVWDQGGATVKTASASKALTGVWTFVVAWYDAGANSIGLQLDGGTPATTSTAGVTIKDGTGTFMIGQLHQVSRAFDGLIDEAFVYMGRVLTSDERDWLYNSGTGRTYSELLAGGGIVPIVVAAHGAYLGAGGML